MSAVALLLLPWQTSIIAGLAVYAVECAFELEVRKLDVVPSGA